MNEYVKLALAAFLPVVAAVVLFVADRKTPFKKLPYAVKQIIFGLIFGALAVVGTEWGIPMNGAQVNCRDAAVLTSGLLFGAPAGIIAGVIGGVERFPRLSRVSMPRSCAASCLKTKSPAGRLPLPSAW